MNIVAKHGCEIILGKTGENDATIVSFPIVYRFKDELGNNGTFTVLYKGPEDDVPYPCVTEVDGNNLNWTIKSPETRAAGYGQCEVMYTRSDGIKKSETFDTRVIESIGDEPGEVPEPQQSWVDMVVAAGATAEQAKQAILALGVQARTVQPDSAAKVIKTTDSAGNVTLTFEIPHGVTGNIGVGIADIEENYVDISGATNTITITLTDGTSKVIYLKNGVKGDSGGSGPEGSRGETGATGATGATGNSGVYIGSTMPTDPDQNVWIDPTGSAMQFKTINGETIIGTGNIYVSGGGSGGAVYSVCGKTGNVTLNASDVGALPSDTEIPTIPTNVSYFINDAGYLTTESDPTVPSWAKQTNKPTYTASEVGARPSSWMPSASDVGAVASSQLFNLIYPVGSYYWTSATTDPNTAFGGTWERVKDRFIYALGDSGNVGDTGGEETHTLTVNEMPEHDHTYARSGYNTGSEWIGGNGTSAIQTGSTGKKGGGQPHNNMPPYIKAYCWHRTA